MHFFTSMLLLATLLPFASCQKSPPLLSQSQGFNLKVFMIVDQRFLNMNNASQLIQETNDLLSQLVNIHLQVTGVVMRDFPDMMTREVKQQIIDELDRKADTVIAVYGQTHGKDVPVFNAENICNRLSVSWVPLKDRIGNLRDKKTIVRFMTGSLLMSILANHNGPTCTCPDNSYSRYCLSDDSNFEHESNGICSCYAHELNQRLQHHHPRYQCLFETADSSLSVIAIKGNGVSELGEPCDCFHFDQTCNAMCDVSPETPSPALPSHSPSTEALPPESFSDSVSSTVGSTSSHNHTIAWMIPVIIVVVILVSTVIGVVTLKLKKKRESNNLKDASDLRSSIEVGSKSHANVRSAIHAP